MRVTFLAFFCQNRTQLHLSKETSNGIRIEAPDIALYGYHLCLMGKARTVRRGKETRCNASQKVPTPTGGIEHTNMCKVLIRCIAAGIKNALNQLWWSREMTALLTFR